MKKIFICVLLTFMMITVSACGKENSNNNDAVRENMNTVDVNKESIGNLESKVKENNDATAIKLTIGDKVMKGYLNDSEPARSLAEQLPMTVTLNDSDNDFCGGNIDIRYTSDDVQSGYKNGDLAFWTPANNFVIFVDDEEKSANTGNLVILGRIDEPQNVLDSLEGSIDVTISLADDNATGNNKNDKTTESNKNDKVIENNQNDNITASNHQEVSEVRVKITVNGESMYAVLEDNATTRAIVAQMPVTLPMMDLYGREMCYRYGAYALPTENMRSDRYEVGDIAYWAPGGSLVILYEQNGERFERQHLGHIESGVEIFKNTGDVNVTFEVAE